MQINSYVCAYVCIVTYVYVYAFNFVTSSVSFDFIVYVFDMCFLLRILTYFLCVHFCVQLLWYCINCKKHYKNIEQHFTNRKKEWAGFPCRNPHYLFSSKVNKSCIWHLSHSYPTGHRIKFNKISLVLMLLLRAHASKILPACQKWQWVRNSCFCDEICSVADKCIG